MTNPGIRKPVSQLVAGDKLRSPFGVFKSITFTQVKVSALGTPMAVEVTFEDGTVRHYGPREWIYAY